VDSRASQLFQQLHSPAAETVIGELILNRQSEELWLDFKQVATQTADTKLHASDRKNLARAISGFGNSVGGIVLWGVECSDRSDNGDVASAKFPITKVGRLKSWLEGATSACSIPPHGGVEHYVISTADSDTGFIATYVPPSPIAPLQPVLQGETSPHCLIRVGSSFMPAPLGLLAGMFGKRPQNRMMEHWIQQSADLMDRGSGAMLVAARWSFFLRNEGPGIAREIYSNVSWIKTEGPSSLNFGAVNDWRWLQNPSGPAMTTLSAVSPDGFKLAPDFPIHLWTISVQLCPPFQSPFFVKVSYGTEGSPSTVREIRHTADELQAIYDDVIESRDTSTFMRPFLRLDEIAR
jgi:hypothetical protein